MKLGRPLPDMLRELQRQDACKRDLLVPANVLSMQNDGQSIFTLADGEGQPLFPMGMTDLFHRQLGGMMKIPADYYDRMRREKPELLAENVNTWLSGMDGNYMIRTMDYCDGRGQIARAFLSERYRRIDNLAIATVLLQLFMGMNGCEVSSSEITETRMYIKLTFHLKQYEVKPGDYVEFGIIISNSEVGLGAVMVCPFLNRLVCSNGLVLNTLGERKHHVGRQVKAGDDSYELYSDATMELEDRAFLSKLQDVARAAMDESRYPAILDQLKESTAAKITGAVPQVVELTARNFGLRKSEQDDMLRYLIEGGDLSLYGLTNAVTRLSQDVDSYDRATELETIGWQINTMEPQMWKAINNG